MPQVENLVEIRIHRRTALGQGGQDGILAAVALISAQASDSVPDGLYRLSLPEE